MVNVSVVLYKSSEEELRRLISHILRSEVLNKLILIDNSPDPTEIGVEDERLVYIFTGKNLGYGRAHNIALRMSLREGVPYHVVMNPDVYFGSDVLKYLLDFMEENPDVGMVAPKVLYPDGSLQYTCRLLPSPKDLFIRRFLNWGPFKPWVEASNWVYEFRFTGYTCFMEPPFLSGCFMFMRTSSVKEIGLFDERFFLYMEDVDLSRRMYSRFRCVFHPHVVIYHVHKKESYRNIIPLIRHVVSAVKYFNKWGWFKDEERTLLNQMALLKVPCTHSRGVHTSS